MYPTLQLEQSNDHSSKQSEGGATGALLENSTPDLENTRSDCASCFHAEEGVADNSLSISAVHKKEDGARMYNKKQYCFYCKIGFIKIARHLERVHHSKPEVAGALSFQKAPKKTNAYGTFEE